MFEGREERMKKLLGVAVSIIDTERSVVDDG